MRLGLENSQLSPFPGVASAEHIRVALTDEIPGTVFWSRMWLRTYEARASHACVRVTHHASGEQLMPAAGRKAFKEKGTLVFSGVPVGFLTDRHFSGGKGAGAEHGLQNEQRLLKYPSV